MSTTDRSTVCTDVPSKNLTSTTIVVGVEKRLGFVKQLVEFIFVNWAVNPLFVMWGCYRW